MEPGIEHLLRESALHLQLILILEALCWFLASTQRGARRLRGPLLFVMAGLVLLGFSYVTEDVRALELVLLCGGVALPAVLLARERIQPGGLRGARALLVLAPAAAVAWMVVRGLVIPAIACAEHAVEHAEVHRQWALEYRALVALEEQRAARTGQSRLGSRLWLPPTTEVVEVMEAAGPSGGWAYTASAIGCSNCRSFYLDSDDRLLSARRRRATPLDRPVHWNEIEFLRGVMLAGCYVMGDVLCR